MNKPTKFPLPEGEQSAAQDGSSLIERASSLTVTDIPSPGTHNIFSRARTRCRHMRT